MKKTLIVLALLLTSTTAFSTGNPCLPKAAEFLANNNINDAKLAYAGAILRKNGTVVSYNYWYRLERCNTGYLVINSSPHCGLMHAYTRGGCEL